MSRRKNDRSSIDSIDEEPREPARSKSGRKKRRLWPWALLILLLLVFFLPTIIASTSLRQTALDYALGEFDGKITIESVSLGWFSPIEVEGTRIYHEDAIPIATIARISSRKTLLECLIDDEFGELEIFEPVFNIKLNANGSNVERAIAKYVPSRSGENATPTKSKPHRLPALTIKCINGSAQILSTASNETWTIDSINLTARISRDSIPLAFEGECLFTSEGTPFGGLAYSAQIDNGAKSLSFSRAQIAISSQNFPLALAAPFIQRLMGPTNTIGHMNTELQLAYDAKAAEVSVNIDQLELMGGGIAAPKLMGQDQIWTESLTVHGQVNLSPRQISASQFELVSDLGNIKADGVFDIDQLNRLVADGELLDTPFSMSGRFDLARVANMIPNTLQLHDDLAVRTGLINFQISNPQQDTHIRRIVFNMDLANIHARRGNQEIVWQKPLRIVGTLNQSDGQIAFDNVRLVSDFLTINGQGSASSGKINVKGDLTQLMERVGQFSDLRGFELAGTLSGHCNWNTNVDSPPAGSLASADRPIQLTGRFDVANPTIHWPGSSRWQPSELSLRLQGAGLSTSESLQIDRGNINLKIGTERLVATLREPINNPWSSETWKLNCRMTGELAGWLGHASNFVDLGDISSSGQLGVTSIATIDSNFVRMSQVRFLVEPFQFEGYGLQINEPEVNGKTELSYDLESGQIVFNDFSAATRSMSVRGETLGIFEIPTAPDGVVQAANNQRPRVKPETTWVLSGQGVTVDQIELTPESCQKLLKFVAPLVADAVRARGKLSVSTTQIRIPISDPLSVEAQGLIRLSEVNIGPGPLANELAGSINQLKSLFKPGSSSTAINSVPGLQMTSQEVPFTIQNQRIFHDNLTFTYKDIQFRTKGSVGIDQTISVVAEFPVLGSWIEDEPWLAGLKGQHVSIPISGTLSAPRLDPRAMQQLSQQLVQQAAGNALERVADSKLGRAQRELNNRLNREINKAHDQINSQFQQEVGEKLENDLRNGLNSLFKKRGEE